VELPGHISTDIPGVPVQQVGNVPRNRRGRRLRARAQSDGLGGRWQRVGVLRDHGVERRGGVDGTCFGHPAVRGARQGDRVVGVGLRGRSCDRCGRERGRLLRLSRERRGNMILVACDNKCDVRCSSELIESCSLEKYVGKRLGRKVPGVCLFKRSHKPRYCPGTELEITEKRGER